MQGEAELPGTAADLEFLRSVAEFGDNVIVVFTGAADFAGRAPPATNATLVHADLGSARQCVLCEFESDFAILLFSAR